MRKILILILILICSLHPSLAEETPRRVFTAEKAQPFGEDEAIFHVYVCPLMGADCMILVQGNDVMLVDMGKANQYADIKTCWIPWALSISITLSTPIRTTIISAP